MFQAVSICARRFLVPSPSPSDPSDPLNNLIQSCFGFSDFSSSSSSRASLAPPWGESSHSALAVPPVAPAGAVAQWIPGAWDSEASPDRSRARGCAPWIRSLPFPVDEESHLADQKWGELSHWGDDVEVGDFVDDFVDDFWNFDPCHVHLYLFHGLRLCPCRPSVQPSPFHLCHLCHLWTSL